MIEGPLTVQCAQPSFATAIKHDAWYLDEEAAQFACPLKEYYLWCEEKRQQLHKEIVMTGLYIGVDGGGTFCRARRLVNGEGTCLGAAVRWLRLIGQRMYERGGQNIPIACF